MIQKIGKITEVEQVKLYHKKSLTEILYKYRNKSLEYGDLDCCVFTAKVVEEYFEIELPLWKDLLTYSTYKDALKVLRKNNIKSVEELPSAILGTEKKPISEVKLGEPVHYVNEIGHDVLGICNGKRAYFIQPEIGLITLPIEDCSGAWSIR